MDSLSRSSQGRLRRGLSLLEALGCVLAIGVGIWAGAMYLGIDLKAACALGLERLGVEAGFAQGDEILASTDLQAVDGVDDAAKSGGPARRNNSAGAGEKMGKDPAPISQREATLTYWNNLRRILLEERQTGTAAAPTDARSVLQLRSEAYRRAADAIRQAAVENVDPELVPLAARLAQWCVRGAEMCDEGALLLDQGDLSAADSPLGKRWHTAERQHREERDLFERKLRSLQSKLTVRYNRTFEHIW